MRNVSMGLAILALAAAPARAAIGFSESIPEPGMWATIVTCLVIAVRGLRRRGSSASQPALTATYAKTDADRRGRIKKH